MNIHDFAHKKAKKEKISMVTCYDYTSARILADSDVDCLLVGDSAAQLMHGHKDTLAANTALMSMHIQAVSRGAGKKFIIGDLPFLSYRKSMDTNISNIEALMQAGANAVKLEGAKGNLKLIQHITESGIPVMGHLGLTPQSVHALGGYKVQGKTYEASAILHEESLLLQEAGCFAIVLECVPYLLAKCISEALIIPTIGIGAGPYTDGQVLVFHDLLGLNSGFKPKFVKQFIDGATLLKDGLNRFVNETKQGDYPQHEHYY
jgi:3-methyl-2-oxobutanoate hydroxymethyltransferase